jgi:hypothetical protein
LSTDIPTYNELGQVHGNVCAALRNKARMCINQEKQVRGGRSYAAMHIRG